MAKNGLTRQQAYAIGELAALVEENHVRRTQNVEALHLLGGVRLIRDILLGKPQSLLKVKGSSCNGLSLLSFYLSFVAAVCAVDRSSKGPVGGGDKRSLLDDYPGSSNICEASFCSFSLLLTVRRLFAV